jgi:hypothetical protein
MKENILKKSCRVLTPFFAGMVVLFRVTTTALAGGEPLKLFDSATVIDSVSANQKADSIAPQVNRVPAVVPAPIISRPRSAKPPEDPATVIKGIRYYHGSVLVKSETDTTILNNLGIRPPSLGLMHLAMRQPV